jgi:cytochrome c oxidase cbb3-type subunit 4
MDVNDWRSLVTVAGLILFLVLVAWTWSGKRRSAHEAAAQLPFADSDHPRAQGSAGREQNDSDVKAGGRRE